MRRARSARRIGGRDDRAVDPHLHHVLDALEVAHALGHVAGLGHVGDLDVAGGLERVVEHAHEGLGVGGGRVLHARAGPDAAAAPAEGVPLGREAPRRAVDDEREGGDRDERAEGQEGDGVEERVHARERQTAEADRADPAHARGVGQDLGDRPGDEPERDDGARPGEQRDPHGQG